MINDLILAEIKNQNRSVRSVCLASDLEYKRISSALKDKRAMKFDDVVKLCRTLHIPLESLVDDVEPEEQRFHQHAIEILNASLKMAKSHRQITNQPIRADEFLDWWYINNGRLENYDRMASSIDIYDAAQPSSDLIAPLNTGPESLASVYFDIENADQLTQVLQGFTRPLNRTLVQAHLDAINANEPVMTHPQIDEKLPNGKRISRRYRRILAPVTDKRGKTLIVNYSQDIPQE